MKVSYITVSGAFTPPPVATSQTLPAASRDFTTLDGRLVPRVLGEIALRQRTALLVGGILIGEWPENI